MFNKCRVGFRAKRLVFRGLKGRFLEMRSDNRLTGDSLDFLLCRGNFPLIILTGDDK